MSLPPGGGATASDAGAAAKVADLLAQMTLDEKIAQLTSVWLLVDRDTGEVAPSQMMHFGDVPGWSAAECLGRGIGHITRPLGSRPIDPVAGAAMINELQRQVIEGSRLGIPAIVHEECLSGAMFQGATSFPTPLNFASTWDPPLIGRVADTIRRQMRAVGVHQGLAPVADVARDARWGRVEETLGEDPYLVGTLVTAYVRGLQGTDTVGLANGVIATLKHFCGYSFSEGGRNLAPAHVGPRELADVFLVPFEMAVRDGGALSVMNAYQEVDGEPPAASHHLLTEVLRERWGFEGFTVADYGAISFLEMLHHVAADATEAAALALRAGLDVELPHAAAYPRGIEEALRRGLVELADVDRAVSRVLRLKVALGLFEHPYVDVAAVASPLHLPADAELSAEVARRSLVLLHNDGVLPLDTERVGSLALVGPNASDVLALFGNYSFENHLVSTHYPDQLDLITSPTVLDVLRERLGSERVVHQRGCDVTGDDRTGLAAAADAARAADVAVVVVGDRAGHFNLGTVGEGSDTTSLTLPGVQEDLILAVLDTGTPTVVVLLSGRPYALARLRERAGAIVEAWFPGEAGAGAITDLLFGDSEPTGRSPLTFSQTAGALPRFYNHKQLAAGFPHQREFPPVFAFGHGLSYTTFVYADLAVAPSTVDVEGSFSVSCTVTNTGDRPGDEVPQLYVHDPVASVTRPVLELKGFARVPLAPGGRAWVTWTVPTDLLAFTGVDGQRRVEPGTIAVRVGASSADIRLRGEVEVTGAVRLVGQRPALTTSVAVRPA